MRAGGAALIGAALGVGCNVDTACVVRPCVTPRSYETYDGEPALDTLSFGCCLAEEDPSCGLVGAWWVSAVVDGTISRATLDLRGGGLSTGGWSEVHTLPLIDRDAQGFWEERGDELTMIDTTDCRPLSSCADRFTAGRNTLFSCTPDDPGGNIRATLRLYADGDEVPFACHSWGGAGAVPAGCVATAPTF